MRFRLLNVAEMWPIFQVLPTLAEQLAAAPGRGAAAAVRRPVPHPGAPLLPGKEEEEEEEEPWVPPSMTFKDGTKCFCERTMHY